MIEGVILINSTSLKQEKYFQLTTHYDGLSKNTKKRFLLKKKQQQEQQQKQQQHLFHAIFLLM